MPCIHGTSWLSVFIDLTGEDMNMKQLLSQGSWLNYHMITHVCQVTCVWAVAQWSTYFPSTFSDFIHVYKALSVHALANCVHMGVFKGW